MAQFARVDQLIESLQQQYKPDELLLMDLWAPEDVLTVRPDLTTEQTEDVMAAVAHGADANIGINWINIETHADMQFPLSLEEPHE